MAMDTDEEIIIPLSKLKLLLGLSGSICFVLLGGWLFTIVDFFIKAVALIAIVFFGVVAIYISKKLFDNSPGLIINSKGIFDNSSGVAVGLIPWDQITGFSVSSIQSQRFLTVHVRYPENYLNKGNFMQRMAIKANANFYDSPVHISPNSLKINFDELVIVIHQYFEKYGNNDSNV
jgi:hypothetical protein